jgi:molybdopterin-guanine dinucleotide biosynthesis protein B
MNSKVISFAARGSGSGKTHIIELLISELKDRGYRVAAVKHSGHMPDFDRSGKDTYRYRQSGADKVMMFSPQGMFMFDQLERSADDIQELAGRDVDIVLMEGFKDGPFPKIEVYSHDLHPVPLSEEYPERFIAIISDTPTAADIPRFGFEDIKQLTNFILTYLSSFESSPVHSG